ncbi:MAG: hypothetical protein FWF81_02855 [Defluviitaleaceae bacterium]|nr:hypothetical protein [Defluviitaleaceae bacterium]
MYLVLFGVGAGFIVLSLLIGELGEIGDMEGPIGFAFFKPKLIAIFFVVMGGLGLLLTPGFRNFFGGDGLVLFISVLGGLAAAGLFNKFVMIPLQKAQNTSTFNIQDTIGTIAEIISPIPQGGYGKIKYNVSGSVVTSPAKSDDGNPINSGETVEIIYIEKNTYFVRQQNKSN